MADIKEAFVICFGSKSTSKIVAVEEEVALFVIYVHIYIK